MKDKKKRFFLIILIFCYLLKTSTYKISDREINVNLKKKTKTDSTNPWPRLTKESVKLPWLKVDFPRNRKFG